VFNFVLLIIDAGEKTREELFKNNQTDYQKGKSVSACRELDAP
jgi:hypothetical protein